MEQVEATLTHVRKESKKGMFSNYITSTINILTYTPDIVKRKLNILSLNLCLVNTSAHKWAFLCFGRSKKFSRGRGDRRDDPETSATTHEKCGKGRSRVRNHPQIRPRGAPALKNKRNTQKNSQKNGLFLPYLSAKFSISPRISMYFLLILKYS